MENKWINIGGGIVFLVIAAAVAILGTIVLAFGALGGLDLILVPGLIVISIFSFFLYFGFKNLLKGGKEVITPEPAAPETTPIPVSSKLINSLVAFAVSYVLSFALLPLLGGSSPEQSPFQGLFNFPVFLASLFAYLYVLNRSMTLLDKVMGGLIIAITMVGILYLPQIMAFYLLGSVF